MHLFLDIQKLYLAGEVFVWFLYDLYQLQILMDLFSIEKRESAKLKKQNQN
jgi:hypothetical protein